MGPSEADVACLVVHGFTGSPYEMKPFADTLSAGGVYVEAPLLPGHGTSVEDMSRTSFSDWTAGAEAAYLSLAPRHRRVFLLGFSMGGLIAMMIAARHRVDGIIVVSAPLRVRDPRARFLPFLALVRKYEPPRPQSPGLHEAVGNRRTVSYSQKPIVCIQSLMRLMQAVKAEAPRIECRLLAIYGAKDRTAPPEDGQWIVDHAGTAGGRLVVLGGSDHFAAFGPDREQLLWEVDAFVGGPFASA